MRAALLLFVIYGHLFGTATVEHLTLNGNDFTIITETYEEYEEKGRVAKFYRDERNYDLTYLFAVTLENVNGPCGARSIEKGAYEIKDDRIVIYTHWDREGKAYFAAKGDRVRVLQADKNGSIRQVHGELYIETMHRAYAKESGMRYLYEKADTPEKNDALSAYIAAVQRRYKATFVRDEAKRKRLAEEVFEALQRKAKRRWK